MSDEVLDTNNEAATFRERLMAYTIDIVIFLVIPAALIKLYMPELWDDLTAYFVGFGSFQQALLFHGFESLISFGLLALFEQTPGKKILNCRVLAKDGSRAHILQLFIREFFGKYISGTIMWVGYLLTAARKDHKALHDLMSDTKVVRDIKNNGTKNALNKNLKLLLALQLVIASIGLKIKYDLYQRFTKSNDDSTPSLVKLLLSKNARKDSLLKDKRDLYAEEVKRLNAMRVKEEEKEKKRIEEIKAQQVASATVTPPATKSPVANQPVAISNLDPLTDEKWQEFYKYGDKLSDEDKQDPRFSRLEAHHLSRYKQERTRYIGEAIRNLNQKGASIHLDFFEDAVFMESYVTKCITYSHMYQPKTFYGKMTALAKDNYIKAFKARRDFGTYCLAEQFKSDPDFLIKLVTEAPSTTPYVAKYVDHPLITEIHLQQKADEAINRIKRSESQIHHLREEDFKTGKLVEYIMLNHTYYYPYLPRSVSVSDGIMIKTLQEIPHSAQFLKNYQPTTPTIKKLFAKSLNASPKEIVTFCRNRLEKISNSEADKWSSTQILAKLLPDTFKNEFELVSTCTKELPVENTFFHAIFHTGNPSEEFKEKVIKENQRRASIGVGYLTFPTHDPKFNSRLYPQR